jgi:hypothetical protein|tara:strand:+ start:104 stop:637 length:534 start_codon:yes stop_codon:yes gene_type:complete
LNAKEELIESIRNGILEIQQHNPTGHSILSKSNPEKVAEILYLHATGVTQTQMIRKYGLKRETIVNVLLDYADFTGKWKQLGSKVRGRAFLELSSLEEDLVNQLRERLEAGEIKPTFKDLLPLSIALEKAEKGSNTFRGEATSIVEERKVISQEDYEATVKAARERIAAVKKDVIDV